MNTKKFYIVILSILVYSLNLFSQNEKMHKIKTDIKSLIVYLDGIEETRQKSVNLTQGRNKLIFEGLSPKINTSSIRVSSTNNTTILAVTSKMNYLTKEKEEQRILKIRDSLKTIIRKINTFNDESGSLKIEKEMLLKNQEIGGQNNGLSVLELQKAADYFRLRMNEIHSKLTKNSYETDELTQHRTRLENELDELNANNSLERLEISLLLQAEKTDTATIELKYIISDAGWTPVYDLKATDIDQPIKLIYRAQVYNNTGIDWVNVKMKLSTADPNSSATKPSLSPWYLNYNNSYKYSYDYEKKGGNVAQSLEQSMTQQSINNMAYLSKEEYAKIDIAPLKKIEVVEVSVLSAEFDIKSSYSIPSDDKPYLVDVIEYNLPATYKHFAIPKLEKAAFLLAQITGWEDLNLVEGYANVYYAGTFVGKSFIYTRNASDTLDFSFGRDHKVYVSRVKLKDYSSTKLIGSKRKETQAFEIIVKNNRKQPIQIEIQDQVPVSQDSEIETSIMQISGAEQDLLSGKLTWKLNLDPAKSEKLSLIYDIKYPKNKPLYNAKEAKRSQNMRFF
jgi:uncharacterized protein (TIGR02231 family)